MLGNKSFQEAGSTCNFKGIERTEHFGQVDIRVPGRQKGRAAGRRRLRINAFELWCWRRLLKFPRTARKYNQAILKEISREYSLEGPMLKLNKLREMVKNRKTWCAGVHGVIKRMT